jgi:hypothetical protein
MYLMKEITKEAMQIELAKREVKRNKHLAIRAVLEMFVNTSTMMLNNIVNMPPASNKEFETTMTEFINLRKYVNDSLLHVSRMKSCSVPQIGDKWEWKGFNKSTSSRRAAATATAPEPSSPTRRTAATAAQPSSPTRRAET